MKIKRLHQYQTPDEIKLYCANKIVDEKGRRRFKGCNEKDENGVKYKKLYPRYTKIF